jgi:Leu/Phe-tRNA-protein transferase
MITDLGSPSGRAKIMYDKLSIAPALERSVRNIVWKITTKAANASVMPPVLCLDIF